MTYEKWYADYYGETQFYKQFETEKKLLELCTNDIGLNDDILEVLECKVMFPKLYDFSFNRILKANDLKWLELFEQKIGHKIP